MKHIVKHPSPRTILPSGTQYGQRRRRAAVIATDKAATLYREDVQRSIRGGGLGRLEKAVGMTSTLKKRYTTGDPFGVVFVKGGEQSRAGQALQIYESGGPIRIRNKPWLAFQTNVIPRRIGPKRERTTPTLYEKYGLSQSIGKLKFRPIGPGRALLVVQKVTQQPKTGRIRPAGKRPSKTRINLKEVVVFILIKATSRNKRYDRKAAARRRASEVPRLISEALRQLERR